ncbi:DUF6896 domain-containing protein [Streptomyces microflavus]|uniref:DUF6896 domain-containing protein n=1 Tax=Streptomyces microflavus TaxID=1919 RepID=UPI0037AF2F98
MSLSSEAAACVRSFLRSREVIMRALEVAYPPFGALENVLVAVRAGELERRARTDSGYSYSVHGRGCLMVGPDGAEVDVDLLLDGSEAFDAWRLAAFARSVGMSPVPPREDLVRACRDLVGRGTLAEPEPEWFRLSR